MRKTICIVAMTKNEEDKITRFRVREMSRCDKKPNCMDNISASQIFNLIERLVKK